MHEVRADGRTIATVEHDPLAVSFRHYRLALSVCGDFQVRGGVTLAVHHHRSTYVPAYEVEVAAAVCSWKDAYVRSIGCVKARGRLATFDPGTRAVRCWTFRYASEEARDANRERDLDAFALKQARALLKVAPAYVTLLQDVPGAFPEGLLLVRAVRGQTFSTVVGRASEVR